MVLRDKYQMCVGRNYAHDQDKNRHRIKEAFSIKSKYSQKKGENAMKKLTMVFSIFLLLLLALAGCSSKQSSSQTNTASSSQTGSAGSSSTSSNGNDIKNKKITISVYYPTPDQKALRALEDDKIKRFEAKYPNVKIVKSDWQYDPSQIGMKMAANEAPTLFNTYATEGKFLAQKGWAADITNLYNNYKYKDQMNPLLENEFIINGHVYGIAQNGYITATMVNKKLLDAKNVPIPSYNWTWNDMLKTAQAVADPKKGIAGIAPMGKANDAGWNWTNFLFEAGGDIQKVANGKVTAEFNSSAGLKALQFYHKLRWQANAIPQDWALNWNDAVTAFVEQRTAMIMAGPAGPVDQALNQGGLKPKDVLVYPMPSENPGGKHTGVLGGNFLVINPNATKAQQEMAFKYATFDYFSDKGLKSLETSIKSRKKDGQFYVPPMINYYKPNSPYGTKVQAVLSKYDNVYTYDPKALKLLSGKPEAQYNTQDYYGAMTNVIQKVFSDKSVNLKQLLDQTATLVQKKYYDPINTK